MKRLPSRSPRPGDPPQPPVPAMTPSTDQTTVSQRIRLVARLLVAAIVPSGVALPPAAAQEARSERLVVSAFVERNVKSQIWFYHAFDSNCVLVRGFNVAVERLPKNGDVQLDKVERVIDESFINTRDSFANIQQVRRCFGRTMPVIMLSYTGKRGYTGFDELVMTNTSADGQSKRIIDFRLGVR